MYGAATAPAREDLAIRYKDHGALAWLSNGAPCRWSGNTSVEFRYVPFRTVQGSASGKHPDVVAAYESKLRLGRAIAPPVVSATEWGTYYVHDGNHRCEAIEKVVAESSEAYVRVAVVAALPGFRFQWRWFGGYGTYILEPENLRRFRPVDRRARPRTRISPLLGRTMILVAHPDDESGGCAALLQRMSDPIVVFATDGAPADRFFWGPFGSREAYSRLRRQEALRGLAGIGVHSVHFLDDDSSAQFLDQQLHHVLPAAISALDALVRRFRPHAILTPAYEGGHPDHDACSFMASVIGDLHAVPVWEMPLYHRRKNGRIICQKFRDLDGTEIRVRCTVSELLNRNALIMNYASQTDLGEFVKSKVEYFRPQRRYDYTEPPHEGTVNYEAWGWPISAADVSRSFERLLHTFGTRPASGQSAPVRGMFLSGEPGLELSLSV